MLTARDSYYMEQNEEALPIPIQQWLDYDDECEFKWGTYLHDKIPN